MVREIVVSDVKERVENALVKAMYQLPPDYLQALRDAEAHEETELGKSVINMLLQNAQYAESEKVATCQDTGMAVLYLEVGQDVHFSGGAIGQALENAVRDAYQGFRKSIVSDPLLRKNTGDNTPPIVHYEIVPGDQVRIQMLMKGFGAEMMSRSRMLPPALGLQGVKAFILDTVLQAGPNACPPVIVGVGLGGSFDSVAYLAKKALLRPLGSSNALEHLAQLEHDLLVEINASGVGPQGLGGRFTALVVNVESYPTHIAALPVAVNLNCSAPRRVAITI